MNPPIAHKSRTLAIPGRIVQTVLNHRYLMEAIKLKDGRAMLNLPQPDVLMTAKPNNHSFGQGIKAGLTF